MTLAESQPSPVELKDFLGDDHQLTYEDPYSLILDLAYLREKVDCVYRAVTDPLETWVGFATRTQYGGALVFKVPTRTLRLALGNMPKGQGTKRTRVLCKALLDPAGRSHLASQFSDQIGFKGLPTEGRSLWDWLDEE
jgi:hypothetical protein